MSANTPNDVAVLIGRFQPVHNGHLALLRRALQLAPLCIVVIGSSRQARTPKNPFTAEERIELIKLALTEEERTRIRFLPLRDYYDSVRWTAAVRAGVAALSGLPRPRVTLVGHLKDATSTYLRQFPGWQLSAEPRSTPVDAAHLRDMLFGADLQQLEPAFAAMALHMPAASLQFLGAWTALPFLPELQAEWNALKQYRALWADAPFPPVFVTVDAVVRCGEQVLLIQRGQSPGKGLWAVPGGFIEQRETAYQSAVRELAEETQLGLLDSDLELALKDKAVFDHPDRSSRGRTITHAFYFDLGEVELPEVKAGDDAKAAQWIPVSSLLSMEDRFHDDHFHMLDHFLRLTSDSPSSE